MVAKLNNILDRILRIALAVLFSGLILIVFVQVMARNVLLMPMSWTLDLAQLVFSWCIFLGAALAFRHDRHYHVDIWGKDSPLQLLPKTVSFLASIAVIYVLAWHGTRMSQIGLDRLSLVLDISEFWFYLPIPICGVLMGLFLIEKLVGGYE